ncbi:MAG: YciI family protein [Actinomycetota bacterium]|nr:YciI family protein [Actinomycetota bacterium]
MQFFVYGRDRPGSLERKMELTERHWAFLDPYADRLIARGPTLDERGDPTGSLHIVDLPDIPAVRTFAYEEPYYVAGIFESVMLCRYVSLLGRAVPSDSGYLVITGGVTPITSKHLFAYGDLFALDGAAHLGRAALLEAPTVDAATRTSPDDATVHRWKRGGRR